MIEHLPNSRLSETLERCLKPLDSPTPRDMVGLGIPKAVEGMLGAGIISKLRPASVLVGIRRVWPEPRVFFTVRTRELRSHAGQISFPGGRADPEDAFPIGTATREAAEEIGLSPKCVHPLGLLDDFPTISRYRVTPVVAWVDDDVKVRPNESEVDEIFEVPLRHLLDRKRYRGQRLAKVGVKMYEFHHGSHRIWGATAGMLWNFVERFDAAMDRSD